MRNSRRSKTRAATRPKTTAAKTKPRAAGKNKPGGGIDFNHAMIYCRDVERSLAFYTRHFGFKSVDQFRYEGKAVYARLVAPSGHGTVALHQAAPGASVSSDGVRLYFEIRDLDSICDKLKRAGVYFSQMPQIMPWGWRHAYLDDPDNHEISLYWAGPNRMQKTVMQAAKQASKEPRAKRARRLL